MADLRVLGLEIIWNFAHECDAARAVGLRRARSDEGLDAEIDRVARVGMWEDGARMRVGVVGDVVRAADSEVHDHEIKYNVRGGGRTG